MAQLPVENPVASKVNAKADTAGEGNDRRRAPRRRARDRIASLDSSDNPALRGRHELKNLMLLVDDDLRQTALALGGVERFLAGSMTLLEKSDVPTEVLSTSLLAQADDEAVLDQLDSLSENLANLRRRMRLIAAALRTPRGAVF